MLVRLSMNTRMNVERFNIRIKIGQKISTKAGLFIFIEMKSVDQVPR